MANFNQAIQWMREGKKVRRKNWVRADLYLFHEYGEIFRNKYLEGVAQPMIFTFSNFEAIDWEIYCKEELCERSMDPKERVFYDRGFEDGKHWNKSDKKPEELLIKRSFSESITYLKNQFDEGNMNEEFYKIQIKTLVESLK